MRFVDKNKNTVNVLVSVADEGTFRQPNSAEEIHAIQASIDHKGIKNNWPQDVMVYDYDLEAWINRRIQA